MSTLVNRVAKSGLITLNLENYFPTETIVSFDIVDYLYKGMVLREKEFRAAMKEVDWADYKDKIIAVHCSADAIVPVWAYMLITTYVSPYAKDIYQGTVEDYYRDYYRDYINDQDYSQYQDQRIVIKGCSDKPVPASAYLELTKALFPFAKSIMYGEPCSTVPIYKRKK